ncbi:MAG: hypothetical protein L3K52_16625 [Candidatus Thiothrix sulfatifontis]|nr:MAG: hypothetical protein L3K52_16625 [Candidatus Thiothrix sulfatifontis]
MSLQKGYALHSQISESLNDLNTTENEFRLTSYGQKFLTVATTLIYYSFTSVIFAGVSVWAFQQYVFDNGANVNGLIYTIALVVSAPIGLALIKHTNFKAMAHAHSLREFGIRALIVLAVLSGLWYEGISSSSNMQEKAFHAVENSKSGNAILNSGVVVSSGGNTALSDAEFKLVSCQRKLKEGSVKDCSNSEARVASLKEQAALDRASINDANIKAITVKQEALSKERDEHALPAAKSFAEMLNASLATGTMVVVLLSSLFFELIHLSSIFSERSYLQRKAALLASLSALKNEYFRLIGKTYSPDDFKDDRVIDLSKDELNTQNSANTMSLEMAIEKVKSDIDSGKSSTDLTLICERLSSYVLGHHRSPQLFLDAAKQILAEYKSEVFEIRTKGIPYSDNKTGFGFVPQTAARFKWMDSEIELPTKPERTFGFIQSGQVAKDRETSLLEENRRKYPQEIVMPMTKRPTPNDYGAVPRKDLQTSVITDTPHLQTSVIQTSVDAYGKAESAAAGTVIDCPNCGKSFKKVNRFHIFCSHSRKKREDGGNCSDEFHNKLNPERAEVLKAKHRRRKA